MITIQELHAYDKLVELNVAAPIECIVDENHLRTLPWVDENDRACQKCFACNTKIFLSQEVESIIKLLIYKN